jgi:colanic acid biosynthesis glycosyl transferase WcaI
MKILLNDFSGHAFTIELARWFAENGYQVTYTYCSTVASPKGDLQSMTRNPTTLEVRPVCLPGERLFDKYHPIKRLRDEVFIGRQVRKICLEFKPDVILSGNTHLLTQREIQNSARIVGARFIFWLQDLYGIGIRENLAKRIPLGRLLGAPFEALEARLLRQSDHVIVISEDFRKETRRLGVADSRVTVIENWAPIDEIPVLPKDNAWSREHDLHDKPVIMYTGTLGLKHNPEILARIAEALADIHDLKVVICSEGIGADYLREQKAARDLDNLVISGFQPFARLPEVMASADILLALLEEDAGSFSVPSKVLSYLCAGRAIALSAPETNLAVRIVREANAGLIFRPGDSPDHLETKMRQLLNDNQARTDYGNSARIYAERSFKIVSIGKNFLRHLRQ